MMSLKIYFYAFLFLFLISFPAFSQYQLSTNRWSIQTNFQYQDVIGGDEAINIGQLGVIDEVKFRPLASVGLQFWRKTTPHKRKYLLGQLGYYNNTYHSNWLTFSIGTGTERVFFKKIVLNYGFNTGVARIKNADVQYIYNDEKWVPTNNRDQPVYNLVLGPRLALGYRLGNAVHPWDIFVTGDLRLHFDSQLEAIVPYNGLGLSIRYGF